PQFPPDFPKIEEAAAAHQPLGGAHRAFSEAAARLGVVSHADAVVARVEDDFVQTDSISLAEGDDFEFLPANVAQYALQHHRSTGGRIFFLRVMAFHNLAAVPVAQGGRSGGRNLEEDIHANREVGA